MDRRGRYLEELSLRYKVSYDKIVDSNDSIEEKIIKHIRSVDDEVVTAMLMDKIEI